MAKIISLSGIIGYEVEAKNIKEQMDAANGEDLRIDINSPGGSVFTGLEIYSMIKNYSGKTETRIVSLGASMGSIIALAGDNKTAEDTAVFMVHNASGFAIGDYRTVQKMADNLKAISNHMINIYAKESGLEKNAIAKMMNEETFLFGDELKQFGFTIVKTEKEKNSETAKALAKLDYDGCIQKMKDAKAEDDELEKVAALIAPGVQEPKQISTTEAVTAALAEDRKKTSEMLRLAGIDKEIIKRCTGGMSVGDFAKAELEKANAVRAATYANGGEVISRGFSKPHDLPSDSVVKDITNKTAIDSWNEVYGKK